MPQPLRALGALVPVLLLLGLSGCGAVLTEGTSDAAGLAGAGISSGITRNGTVTAAIGLGVQSLASTGLSYVERRVHRAEQDQIAAAAGPLPVGGVAPWRVSHDIPIEANEHGEVAVSRAIGGAELECKEIVFSVDHPRRAGVQRAFYVAAVCRDGAVWRWATAEPATSRWGTLQ
ncbi:MAG: hypothetical protein JO209_07390 [Acidisphaera sp.]|nr:hypothetical protein [Acidisphaera sp.]